MSTATDLLKNLNGNTYNASTNPYGLDGVGGMDANLVAGFNAMGTAGDEVAAASALAVPAATTATTAATTATTQAAIAVAAANTAVGTSLIKQPSEIAGIDPALDFVFSSSLAVPAGVIQGSSSKWVTDRAGLLTSVAAGTCPVDFDPTTSALKGLLAEEARTNRLTYSQQIDNAAWAKVNVAVTANAATAPDGSTTADLVAATTANAQHTLLQSATTAPNGSYTLSIFAKAAGLTKISLLVDKDGAFVDRIQADFDLTAVTATASTAGSASGVSAAIKPLANGWYRCSVSGTVSATAGTTVRSVIYIGGVPAFTGDGVSGVYLWQAQKEAGSFATSPIVTTASAVPRAADVNAITLSSVPGWNASEGTIYVEARTALASGTQTYAQYDDGTANNRLCVYRDSSNVLRCIVVVSGSTVVNLNLGTVANDTLFKVAFAWKANSFAASVNGGAAVTSSSGAIPPGLTTHRIGHDSSGNHANGPIRRDVGFPRAVTSATTTLLTA